MTVFLFFADDVSPGVFLREFLRNTCGRATGELKNWLQTFQKKKCIPNMAIVAPNRRTVHRRNYRSMKVQGAAAGSSRENETQTAASPCPF